MLEHSCTQILRRSINVYKITPLINVMKDIRVVEYFTLKLISNNSIIAKRGFMCFAKIILFFNVCFFSEGDYFVLSHQGAIEELG